MPLDPEALARALVEIASAEARFTERFYELFFDRRPDARPLFGPYSLAEQEEMMGETLRSLLALGEGADWLDGNLVALGQSHWEYGVTNDMYVDFVDVLVECGHEILGASLDDEAIAALRRAAHDITARMAGAATAAEERTRS